MNSPPTFPPLRVPGLDGIPVVGQALFGQSVLFYLALAAIAGSELMFVRTRLGLRIRAAGDNPPAALSSGVNVRRLRYGVGLVAGAIAGAGGAFFTVGSSGGFLPQMTAGLGYVALASVVFGGWRTGRAALAALMFGFATSMATSLGLLNVSVNPNPLVALPYLVTIVVVAGAAATGRRRRPARRQLRRHHDRAADYRPGPVLCGRPSRPLARGRGAGRGLPRARLLRRDRAPDRSGPDRPHPGRRARLLRIAGGGQARGPARGRGHRAGLRAGGRRDPELDHVVQGRPRLQRILFHRRARARRRALLPIRALRGRVRAERLAAGTAVVPAGHAAVLPGARRPR